MAEAEVEECRPRMASMVKDLPGVTGGLGEPLSLPEELGAPPVIRSMGGPRKWWPRGLYASRGFCIILNKSVMEASCSSTSGDNTGEQLIDEVRPNTFQRLCHNNLPKFWWWK